MNKKDKKIAIIGMACRLPGKIQSPDDYWNILDQGQDVVTEVSSKRWGTDFYTHPDKLEPGKSYTFAAGVLEGIDQFDPAFFGISPREADQMDPQQRLLLELAWETFEDAGIPEKDIQGTKCAVYMGIASNDYAHRRTDDLASLDAYTMTGNTASVASNRISYTFDLRGPSVSVDTACSSSLVAIHQACKSLWTNEASTALCGGINMLVHPFPFIGFSKASMLSPDGRCKAFDDSGNGYVRAEGAGMLLLKTLEDAERDGDNIHAIIVNSGVNCDGSTSSITVPGMETQSALLETVYKNTNVTPDDLSYLEAHGTGTAVGDPLEATALGLSIGQQRDKQSPLLIGSAKTNLGHLETASGMAGLLKATLALKNKIIPASLHFTTPNKNIDFETLNLKVVTENIPLHDQKKPHYIGINSFGFGGANAHILLEEYKPRTEKSQKAKSAIENTPPLIISAKSQESLQELAGLYAERIKDCASHDYYDIAYSSRFKRSRLSCALALSAKSPIEAIENLQSFATSKRTSKIVTSEQLPNAKLAFVFTGNGCQSQGMGQALYETNSTFRSAFDTVELISSRLTKAYSLKEELFKESEDTSLHKTEIAQPLLFAIQVALVETLKTYGIQPQAVVGHSVGEVAAAWASGSLTLEDATTVIYHRSQAQGLTAGQGKMAAVGMTKPALNELLERWNTPHSIEVAGENSPNAITIAGELKDLNKLENELEDKGIFYRLLDLDYAFHSQQMNDIEMPIKSALESINPQQSSLPFFSTVTGAKLDGTELAADYWWKNIRNPVQFESAISNLINDEYNVFVEIGPHPILRGYINESLKESGKKGLVLETLKRNQDSDARLHNSAMKIILSGCDIDDSKFFPIEGRYTQLPSYPWQRQHHWYPLTSEGYDLVNRRREHPLLGYRLESSDIIWENNIDTTELPYLADHVVDDAVVLPAAAFIEMALAASKSWLNEETQLLEMVEIPAPIILEKGKSKKIRFHLEPKDGSFRICSRDRLSDDEWTQNAMGRLLGKTFKKPSEHQVKFPKDDLTSNVCGVEHYELASTVGLDYGQCFQAVKEVQASTQMAIATLKLPEVLEVGIENYLLHPSILDSGFQVLVDICRDAILNGERKALIPIQIGRLHLYSSQASHATQIHVQIVRQSPRSVVANFSLTDNSGAVLAELQSCRFRQLQLKNAINNQVSQYHYTAQLQSHSKLWPESPKTAPAILLAAIQETLKESSEDDRRAKHYQEYTLLIDMICTAYAQHAVLSLCDNKLTLPLEDLERQVANEQKPLLTHLLTLLDDNERLSISADTITLSNDEPEDIDSIWQHIVKSSPSYLPELLLLSQHGECLTEILKGNINATDLMHDEKSSLFEQMLEVGSSYRVFNEALSHAVTNQILGWPGNQTFKILIISDLPEQLVSQILPTLKNHNTELMVAGSNEATLDALDRLLEDYDWASTLVIDQKQLNDISSQNPFDLIIASHVLHQFDHLPTSLLKLRSLLNKGGQLITLERTPDNFTNLTFGADPDWWYEGHSRMMSSQEWQVLLEKAGFSDYQHINEQLHTLEDEGVFLISVVNQNTLIDIDDTTQQALEPQKWLILTPDTSDSPLEELLATAESNNVIVTVASAANAFKQIEENRYSFNLLKAEDYFNLVSLDTFDRVILVSHTNDCGLMQTTDAFNPLLLALEQIKEKPQLVLITQGAAVFSQDEENNNLNPASSPIWGLGRVIMNEYPDLNCRNIDIQGEKGSQEITKRLVLDILHDEGESEVVISPDARQVLRLEKKTTNETTPSSTYQAAALDFKVAGSFKNLYWRTLPDVDLQAGEIEIQPVAAGLNFRDLMYAMGMLSDEAVENGFAGATLGMEVAGIITRISKEVQDYKVGDAVLGFSPACFSNRVITQTTATAHKPESWSFEEAATIPTAFFTVYYAFVHLAQIQPGEKVLIHGASGGVGLAAIQLAKHLGAVIFATAGTDEKRALVKGLGADYVLDSRSLAFAEDVLSLTEGGGVDVILNSVYGEAINRNLSILRPFGRFLELGKRDFYENSRIGLRPFRNNITYFGIDADQLLIERIDLAKRLFKELMSLFNEGRLHPLPHRVFDASRIQDAFRYMQQSRQIGKVVVNLPKVLPAETNQQKLKGILELKPEANYLVTGGLSGFGLETAKWLANKGAKHITLLGRKGLVTEEAIDAVSMLEQSGVTVYTPPCDISDAVQVKNVLHKLNVDAPKLGGIIHAATLFDDALLRNLTPERMRTVLAPKALGAWHLHEHTKTEQLDFFVMYSSATTLFGNPGQGNYVAANYMLENLTSYRRAQGLVASFAAWGAISDVGVLARDKETKDSLISRLGGSALTSQQALNELEQLILSGGEGAAFIDFDWKAIKRAIPSSKSAKFTEQNSWLLRHGGDDDAEDFFSKLEGLDDKEIQTLISDLLAKEISHILRLPIEKIDQNCSVYDLGMDSLMGMELLMAIEDKFNTKLPLMTLSEGGSIKKIAAKIHAKLENQDSDDELVVEDLALKHGAELSDKSIDELKQSSNG